MRSSRKSPAPDDETRRLETSAYRHYGYEPAERTVRVESDGTDYQVRIVTFGEPTDEPPVLLLHGIASVSVIAAPLLPYLKGRQVFAVDWPGHGLSGLSVLARGADLRAHAVGVVRGLLDTLGLAQVDVVGHSLGGQFGLYACLQLGTRIRRVVLLGTPGAAFSGVRPVPVMRALAVPGLGRWMLSLPVSPKAFRRNNEKMLGTGALDGLPVDLLDAARALSGRPDFAASVSSYFRALIVRGSVRAGVAIPPAELAGISQPVLLVWGDEDVFMRPDDAAESLASFTDHHLVRVPGAGHAPWLQDLGRVGDAIADHLQPKVTAG